MTATPDRPGSQGRSAARALLDALAARGIDTVFGVPGESYLAVLDALVDVPSIRFITCRQEGGAAYMADAWARMTGKPGICFVTRGPGIANAFVGIHTAQQDSTPLVVFMGQVARGDLEREAFQEVDVRKVFGSVAKWAAQIDDPERVPEFVARALRTAASGRPGPVVLALPEDILPMAIAAADVPPSDPVAGEVSPMTAAAVAARLATAQRPLMIVGGGGWGAATRAAAATFAEAWAIPACAAFRCQDYVDNDHPAYAGDVGIGPNPALAARVREADLLLVLGARLGEMTTGGYTLVRPPVPDQALIHVHPAAEELGRVFHPEIAINAAPAAFLAAMAALDPPTPGADRRARLAAARTEYEAWQAPVTNPGPVQMAEIATHLARRLPPDAVLCNGAGNYAGWFHRFHRWRGWRTQLAPTNGSMGYGVPAAIAAKLACPDRVVVALAGDGCFLMNGQELATAAQYGAAIIVLVIDNGMYGTIRMHQEAGYPGRVSATALANPDFVAYARAFGFDATAVTETAQFAPALEAALAVGRPALIAIRLDPEAITSRRTLSEIRAAAGAPAAR